MFTIQYYGSRITIHSLMSEFAKNICHALHSTRQSPVHEFLKAMFDIGDCSNILNITTMVLIIEHHHRSNIILLYSISMRNAHCGMTGNKVILTYIITFMIYFHRLESILSGLDSLIEESGIWGPPQIPGSNFKGSHVK